MTRLLAVAALAFGVAVAADDKAGKDELARFSGTWRGVSVSRDGKAAPKTEAEAVRLVGESGKRVGWIVPILVLLDPGRYVDTATYADPARSPDGVAGVWVNGVATLRDGVPTGARPGGVLR